MTLQWNLRVPHTPKARAARRPRARELPADQLLIDEQTFRDLEIFGGRDGEPGLFELLNRTRTLGGARVLRARFRRPFASAARIREVQQSLATIERHRRLFSLLPGEGIVDSIDKYLHSNRGVLATDSRIAASLEALELRLFDRAGFLQLAMGVRRALRLVDVLARLAGREELADAPGDLGRILAEVRELVGGGGLRELPAEARTEPAGSRLLRLDRRLRQRERRTLERLLQLVHELDAIVSMADATREYGFAIPELGDGAAEVHGEGIRHPFLPESIANPLRLTQERRLLFLTGPNMAGKTTYLRACGTAVYLAHVGMGVPAERFRFTPAGALLSAISLTDDVRQGVSFFRAEALRVRAVAQALADGRRVVALLDEPFKGTNLKDALEASAAIFGRLSEAEGSLFLVSSHLIEVADTLQATGRVECRRFDAIEDRGRLEFDYVLRPGISAQRLGIRVLEEEGVFELLARGR